MNQLPAEEHLEITLNLMNPSQKDLYRRFVEYCEEHRKTIHDLDDGELFHILGWLEPVPSEEVEEAL